MILSGKIYRYNGSEIFEVLDASIPDSNLISIRILRVHPSLSPLRIGSRWLYTHWFISNLCDEVTDQEEIKKHIECCEIMALASLSM